MTHNALETLFGSGDPERDRARRNTVKSMASPGDRPQEIYTPQCIVDVLRVVWPEGVALDPCHGPESIVGAARTLDGSSDAQNGLLMPWVDRSFFNPPYKTLKAWLAKAVAEAENGYEIIHLGPVRTHRVWWRHTADTATRVRYLDPLAFRGFKQSFPAPLCLMYWGTRTQAFDKACDAVSKP